MATEIVMSTVEQTQARSAVAKEVGGLNDSAEQVEIDRQSEEIIVVSFPPHDEKNPHNWKKGRRAYIVFTAIAASISSTMGSAITANLIPYLQEEFHVPSGPQTILPASVYLLGFVFGPLIFAPLSEHYGRKPVLLTGSSLFVLSTMASALAPNWASFLFFRFLTGIFGAPPMSIMGGVIADVFEDSATRGTMMMTWSAAIFLGPLVAPIISGFTGAWNWRWAIWITLMISGVSFVAVLILPETLAAKLLRDKAARLNKEYNCQSYISPADVDRPSLFIFLRNTISRPLYLVFHELRLALTCLYMAFVYAVFYMMLEIFSTIFTGVYGISPGLAGVAFTLMGVGSFFACMVHLWYDRIAPRVSAKHPKRQAEYLRLPIACAGGPAFVVALLWLGWTSNPRIPWPVPLLSIIPYGWAYQMIFMAMINYITDAYSIYAASALAAMGATRSIAGAMIPLAVNNMLDTLGVAWSCTLLAGVSAVLSVVPFCFIIWAEEIRKHSRFGSDGKEEENQETAQADLALTRSLSVV